ncbi:MAG: DUF5320 domain-containing protein [Bacteroidetes bacterium]|nr:DUF5320 domain-containing protein [Bacteroidota bacterium]
MPNRDGKGPPWGSGPGTGRRREQFSGVKNNSISDNGNKSQSIITIIGNTVALFASIVKIFSSKKQNEKEALNNKNDNQQGGD